ncbi:MAG: endonuclease domain-containing protein [Bacteroidales bacterium]|nr:endonuclease domain-containing protein [Bacteroidales bacterium]
MRRTLDGIPETPNLFHNPYYLLQSSPIKHRHPGVLALGFTPSRPGTQDSKFWSLFNALLMAYLGRSVDQSFFFGASPEIKARAKALRKRMTWCEKVLWQVLRKNQRYYLYFRRQHPIARFIVDFYCHELRLVVEIDGGYHNSRAQQEKDLNRTAALESFGIEVIRFTNEEIMKNLRKVSNNIDEEVKNRLNRNEPHPSPPLSSTTA